MPRIPTLPVRLGLAGLLAAATFGLAAHGQGSPAPPGPGPTTSAPPALSWADLEGEVLYFVMVDRFANGDPGNDAPPHPERRGAFQGGDLKGLSAKLGHLEALGVTAVWLTPLARQVDTEVYGAGFRDTAYHGYWPVDLAGLDPRFGTEEDLDHLVAEAHRRGMKVVLDVVTNHVGYGSPMVHDTARVRSGEGCPGPDDATDLDACLLGLPDLRTEKPEVAAWVVDRTAAWVERYHVDGLRLDAMKHVHDPVFRALAERLATEGPGGGPVFTVGEVWGAEPDLDGPPRPIADGLTTTLIDFSFHGLVEAFLTGRMRAEAFAHHLEVRHRAPGPPLAHFLDSHDTTTFLARLTPEQRHRYPLAALVQMTVRGMPIVSWGDEVGRRGGAWPDNREAMPWARTEAGEGREWLSAWSGLIHLRRAQPALRGRSYATLHAKTGPAGADVVYRRGEGTGRLLVALRRGQGAGPIQVALAAGERLVPCQSVGAPVLLEGPARTGGPWSLALAPDSGAVLEVVPPGGAPRCR